MALFCFPLTRASAPAANQEEKASYDGVKTHTLFLHSLLHSLHYNWINLYTFCIQKGYVQYNCSWHQPIIIQIITVNWTEHYSEVHMQGMVITTGSGCYSALYYDYGVDHVLLHRHCHCLSFCETYEFIATAKLFYMHVLPSTFHLRVPPFQPHTLCELLCISEHCLCKYWYIQEELRKQRVATMLCSGESVLMGMWV